MTLEKTLFSYERAGLLDMAAAAHIYFQELDSPERMACNKHHDHAHATIEAGR